MTRRVRAGLAAAVVLLVAGCADRLVELPTERAPAVPVQLTAGAVRCPAGTVLLSDDDPDSGSGAIPAEFDARTVVMCYVDYQTTTSRDGTDTFTVRQWRADLGPELRASFDLADRELRPAVACAAGRGGTTAIYVVDGARRAVRVLVPYDDPCHDIRSEVAALLPTQDNRADDTFRVSRPSR